MTAQAQSTQPVADNNKEANFRAQEKALKDNYERQLAQYQSERERLLRDLEAAKQVAERERYSPKHEEDEEDDSEPYVDKKKLNKTLTRFEQKAQKQTQSEIEKAIQIAKQEAKKEAYLENNPDFYDILSHAEKLYTEAPEVANSILSMPDNFERQKLVVNTIKRLKLHKEKEENPIQEKIQNNQRGQYYQPTNTATAPYQGTIADFSPAGQEAAYKKMQDKIKNVRLS